MLMDIIYDFFSGIFESLRFDIFISGILKNAKLRSICWKLLTFNVMVHIIPHIIFDFLGIHYITNNIVTIINLWSTIFHIIYFVDLAKINYNPIISTKTDISAIDTATVICTMVIYQFTISISNILCGYIFYHNIFYILHLINYVLTTIYHSFCYYNNRWQQDHINIPQRIHHYETRWIYYFGYGTIATILYNYIGNVYVFCIYNLYTIMCITIPLMHKISFDKRSPSYGKINMSIFSYLGGWIISCIKIMVS